MHLETASAQIRPSSAQIFPKLLGWLMVLAILGGLISGYYFTATPITLEVAGQTFPLRSHRPIVADVLRQTGLTLHPEDRVSPSRRHRLEAGQSLQLALARPVIIDIGDVGHQQPQTIYTHQQTPLEIYQTLNIALVEADDVYVNGVLWPHNRPLPVTVADVPATAIALKARIAALRPNPVRLALNKAVPIQLIDGDQQATFYTTHQTIGDLLVARNIPLYLGDAITPDLSTPLTPDTTITIERAVPVTIIVDGKPIQTRTRQQRVGQVLAQEGVALMGQDYTVPSETSLIEAEATIEVVRVIEAMRIEKETTDFETLWVPDETLELDRQIIQQEGQQGVTKTRSRVRYENGRLVWQQHEDTWLEQEAADKIIAYGTRVVIKTLDTGTEEIEYWRKIRMLATSYSAATSGKDKDHPAYGITRTGLQAGYGVVAVDPGVIDLRSQVYVPGYGQAIAGDTGGSILGKHIDLGFDEDRPPLWYRWVDVYLLTPAPPWYEIRYVLPQWPQER